jgi:hypothetical protein
MVCGFYPLVEHDCFDIFPETWAWESTPLVLYLCREWQRDMLAVTRHAVHVTCMQEVHKYVQYVVGNVESMASIIGIVE